MPPGSHEEWGGGKGRQGFLRFALLGQKCLKQWGTCHPDPQPATAPYLHTHTHTYARTGRQCCAAHQGMSSPHCSGVLMGGGGLKEHLLSPMHVLPRPPWGCGLPCFLYPLSLPWGTDSFISPVPWLSPLVPSSHP